MPKVKLSEYSQTAANNTDINSINLAEGMLPSDVNNAIRELMKQLKDFQVGAQGDGATFSSLNLTTTPLAIASGGTGATTLLSANIPVINSGNTFTAAQTFRAANAVRSEAASTQDAIVVAGRAGGTSSYAVTLTPTTLSANRTLTLPNATDTVAVLGTAQSFTATQTFKGLTDTVYTITDGAAFEIDPANGSVQIVTLGANRTPAATNFAAGQSVLLGIDDGSAYAITWTTVAPTWVKSGGGGAAPTLATTGYTWVLLWKVSTTMYGAVVGSP